MSISLSATLSPSPQSSPSRNSANADT
jgi:hypothetical protein